jgi:hypothetical protein
MRTKASAKGWWKRGRGRADRPKSSLPTSKPRMGYRVTIMPRAQRDLADV